MTWLINGIYNEEEMHWRWACRSYHLKYNYANGIKKPPWLGLKHTIEYKQNMSKALIGRIIPDEHREKICISMIGERHPRFGKLLSEEHKQKISLTKKNQQTGKVIF